MSWTPTRALARPLFHSRLVQFVVLGAAIFAVTRARGPDRLARIDLARAALTAPAGVDAAERAVEDEILFREGSKLGFDKDDSIIRQRVIQKTLYLAEELAGASEPPGDAELHAFYDRTQARWRQPEAWHLVQVFAHDRAALDALLPELATPGDRLAAPGEDRLAAPGGHLAAPGGQDEIARVAALGEPSPLPAELELARPQLDAQLGDGFAAALPHAATAGFIGPLRSTFGWHAVRVVGYTPAAPARFDQVRAALVGAYVVERRRAAVAAFLARAFPAYDVTIDGQPVGALHPDGRVAIRKSASAED